MEIVRIQDSEELLQAVRYSEVPARFPWSALIASPQLRKLNRRTELGYAVFRCGARSNERSGTPFHGSIANLQFLRSVIGIEIRKPLKTLGTARSTFA